MSFKKSLANFLGFQGTSNNQQEDASDNCKTENSKINVPEVKEAITQGNFTYLYKFLNNKSCIHQLINGNPGIYHNILHLLFQETFSYKNPTYLYNISGCTVPEAELKYRDILLRFISVGKDEHFKIKRVVRIPIILGRDKWTGNVTLLMDAILHNASCEVICALIDAGSDVNACTVDGNPLLFALQYHRNNNVFAELIKRGADVNKRYQNGRTILFYTVGYTVRYLTLLISAGVNVCERDNAGRNILMLFTCNCVNKYECGVKRDIDLLINNGINISDSDIRGNRVIHTTNCRNLLNLAIKCDIEAKNNQGSTALMKAAMSSNLGKINYLLLSGADPNCTDLDSNTPLHSIYKQFGDCYIEYSVVNTLLFYGADLYFRNAEGKTPLDVLFDRNFHSSIGFFVDDVIIISLKYLLLFIEDEFSKRNFISNDSDDDDDDDENSIDDLIEDCKREMNLMKKVYLKDGLTYYDFCILKKFHNSKHVNISKDKYELKFKEIYELFPFYKNIICIRLNYCFSKTKKNNLRKKFENITLGPFTNDVDAQIELNYDCLYNISHYLNNDDMHNIFSAAIGDV